MSMQIIGHRGAAGLVPENTLASFRRAIDLGANGVELDIRRLGNTLVVIHDATLERTTNGAGELRALELAELRALDAGGGERVPLLEEVLQLIDARCLLNIEIKECGLTELLLEIIARHQRQQPRWAGGMMLSSFHAQPLREIARARPAGCLLAALSDRQFDETLGLAREIGADAVNVSLEELNPGLVRRAHAEHFRLFVYTVNDPADIARCNELGVDGIFTDFPDRAIAFLEESPMIAQDSRDRQTD